MCECHLAELYAKTARERDELRRELETVTRDRDSLLRAIDEQELRHRDLKAAIDEREMIIENLEQENRALAEKLRRAQDGGPADRELLRDSNFEE